MNEDDGKHFHILQFLSKVVKIKFNLHALTVSLHIFFNPFGYFYPFGYFNRDLLNSPFYIHTIKKAYIN